MLVSVVPCLWGSLLVSVFVFFFFLGGEEHAKLTRKPVSNLKGPPANGKLESKNDVALGSRTPSGCPTMIRKLI
ncbi:hypothetical protein ACE6H2_001319 [Prunus campanulata]